LFFNILFPKKGRAMIMTELSPSLLSRTEKFDRLSQQRAILLEKLELNTDEFRAIVYRRSIDRISRSIDLVKTNIASMEVFS